MKTAIERLRDFLIESLQLSVRETRAFIGNLPRGPAKVAGDLGDVPLMAGHEISNIVIFHSIYYVYIGSEPKIFITVPPNKSIDFWIPSGLDLSGICNIVRQSIIATNDYMKEVMEIISWMPGETFINYAATSRTNREICRRFAGELGGFPRISPKGAAAIFRNFPLVTWTDLRIVVPAMRSEMWTFPEIAALRSAKRLDVGEYTGDLHKIIGNSPVLESLIIRSVGSFYRLNCANLRHFAAKSPTVADVFGCKKIKKMQFKHISYGVLRNSSRIFSKFPELMQVSWEKVIL